MTMFDWPGHSPIVNPIERTLVNISVNPIEHLWNIVKEH